MRILQTQRLSLREFVPEDVNALAAILSDPETMQYYPVSFDHAAVVDWIARNRARYVNDGYGLWAMILNSTGELIGDCGLVRQTVDGTDEVEIGYHVRGDQWGQGGAPGPAGRERLADGERAVDELLAGRDERGGDAVCGQLV